jgi:hypothetical protein
MTQTVITLGDDGVLTDAQFRQLIPAFKDTTKYVEGDFDLNLTLAASMVGTNWKDWRPMGMALVVAHWAALDAREAAVASKGGVPGQGSVGILSSKSIGSVSGSYDVSTGSYANAGIWNSTSFGRRYWQMLRLVGMGGIQITGSDAADASGGSPQRPLY